MIHWARAIVLGLAGGGLFLAGHFWRSVGTGRPVYELLPDTVVLAVATVLAGVVGFGAVAFNVSRIERLERERRQLEVIRTASALASYWSVTSVKFGNAALSAWLSARLDAVPVFAGQAQGYLKAAAEHLPTFTTAGHEQLLPVFAVLPRDVSASCFQEIQAAQTFAKQAREKFEQGPPNDRVCANLLRTAARLSVLDQAIVTFAEQGSAVISLGRGEVEAQSHLIWCRDLEVCLDKVRTRRDELAQGTIDYDMDDAAVEILEVELERLRQGGRPFPT